jgi:Zn-finger nucleic acid-binding protein
MKCPACKEPDLVMSDRQGIEIDYCPKCRGVWLDRGELDKIIERSSQVGAGPASLPAQSIPQHPQPQRPVNVHDSHYGQPYKRRKSWLSELFD